MIEIPDAATSLGAFSGRDQRTLRRLDEIFWKELSEMDSGRILEEVNPVGGLEKAEAVQDVMKRMKSRLSNVVYFGDSITDLHCFQLARENGGLAVSFNGNNYAIREAEIAVLAENTIVTAILADVFNRLGKEGVLQLLKDWSRSTLPKYCTPSLLERLFKLYPEGLPRVEMITSRNREQLMKESTAFRKTVRGEAIGELG
jgi:energy-converting hydrogenase A subunit R